MAKRPWHTRAGEAVVKEAAVAGMTAEKPRPGLGRDVDVGFVLRPRDVYLDLARGVIGYDPRDCVGADVRPSQVLDEFIRLIDASDRELLAFASRVGVLGVEPFWKLEPGADTLEAWRHWIRKVRGVLMVTAAFRQGRTISDKDWADMVPTTVDVRVTQFDSNPKLDRESRYKLVVANCISDSVNEFLEVSHVRPMMSWWKTATGITYGNLPDGSITISGVLAIQLVLACRAADHLVECSGCHHLYERQWSSPKQRNNYCSECGTRAAWRDSKRRRRAAPAKRRAS